MWVLRMGNYAVVFFLGTLRQAESEETWVSRSVIYAAVLAQGYRDGEGAVRRESRELTTRL